MHQLTISTGEVVELLHAVRRMVQSQVDTLKKQARASPILYADETSWRENGQNGYIWAFSTPGEDAVRYYEYDHSRGQAVVKRILGGRFDGHLVSDFYCGYNAYAWQTSALLGTSAAGFARAQGGAGRRPCRCCVGTVGAGAV